MSTQYSPVHVRMVEGWPLATIDGSDEPRIRDLDLAEKLGYERPRDVRKLIARLIEAGKLKDVRVRATVARTQMPTGGTRETEVTEYWLTEGQALKVSARSETDVADALLDQMIGVFSSFLRGQLAVTQVVRLANPAAAIEHHPAMAVQVKRLIGELAGRKGVSVSAVGGWIRRLYRVPGYRFIAQEMAGQLKDLLTGEILGLCISPDDADLIRRISEHRPPYQTSLMDLRRRH